MKSTYVIQYALLRFITSLLVIPLHTLLFHTSEAAFRLNTVPVVSEATTAAINALEYVCSAVKAV